MGATKSIRRLLATGLIAVAAIGVLAGPASAVESADEAHVEDAVHAIEEAKAAGEIDLDTEECVVAALENNDPERCQESPSPILPATNEILWGGLAFAFLLVALWKFGIPAATKMMDERTERIRADLDTAEKARVEAETVLAEYRTQLAEARTESSSIIEASRAQGEQVRRDLIARAEGEAAELRARNAEQLTGERERVLSELRGQVASLAVELAEKVVESSLDREANLALIENYINSVGTGGLAGGSR